MKKRRIPQLLSSFAVAAATLIWPAAAQPQGALDPPSRIARLSYVTGAVSFEPAGTDDWAPAFINRPFTTGDNLWVDRDARAELHMGSGAVRIGGSSSVGILNLDDRNTQIRLAQGVLEVRVRRLDENESFEIDTPNSAIVILRPGRYRVEVPENGALARVSVREGQVEVTTNGQQAFGIRAGEGADILGFDDTHYVRTGGSPFDRFDQFCADRDRREDQSRSARYVSREMIGYADLDDNGDWQADSAYGSVWFPRAVAADWAPYHNGHWVWMDPWGWNWVDEASWGFAPFHYGRWVTVSGRWGWIPGPVAVRPVYAPALVAFVGGGGGFRFAASVGGGGGGPAVAWFPLGPGELYTPSYRVGARYFERVNVSNTVVNKTVNITNVYNTTYINNTTIVNKTVNQTYINRQAPNAVTAIPQAAFGSGRPVARAAVQVSRADIASQPVSAGFVGIAPTRTSVAARLGDASARPPVAIMNRTVVSRQAPPAPPAAWNARQQAIGNNQGRPLDENQIRDLRRQQQTPEMHPRVRQVDTAGKTVAPAGGPGPGSAPRPMDRRPEEGPRPGPAIAPVQMNPQQRPTEFARPVVPANPAVPAAPAPVMQTPKPAESPRPGDPRVREQRREERPVDPRVREQRREERQVARPPERPVIQQEKPIERPIVTPAPPRPAERPIERPIVTPAPPRPAERPIERPIVTPAPPRPTERPIERPIVTPAPPRPAERPMVTPIPPRPAERSVEQPKPEVRKPERKQDPRDEKKAEKEKEKEKKP